MFLNVPYRALNLPSSWVTLRGTPDPLIAPGRYQNQPPIPLPLAPAGETILPQPAIGPIPLIASSRHNRPPVIRYHTTGPTGALQTIQSPLPLRAKQFCQSRPLAGTPCPCCDFETASPGIQEFREHHTPGNLYLIWAVGCQPYTL